MKNIRALLVFIFCQKAVVGVGESDVTDQSAPAQTAPQQAGFGWD